MSDLIGTFREELTARGSALYKLMVAMDKNELTKEQAMVIVRRYALVIAPRFIGWMAQAGEFARHPFAKYAVRENLEVELRDYHDRMLMKFADPCLRLIRPKHQSMEWIAINGAVGLIDHQLRGEQKGLDGIAVMALLEAASLDFIPVLQKVGTIAGCKEMQYIEVHGEADKAHADQFAHALELERREWPKGLYESIERVNAHHSLLPFLGQIFDIIDVNCGVLGYELCED